MARVVIGLSGGVDSSVAAYLLKQQGHEVIGLFMVNWHDTTGTLEGDCPWHDDRVFAELVAKKLDIPLHVVDLSADYRARVVDYMFAEYERGRTPNPDVLCNREIKFDVFLHEALKLGAEFVATGHYCRKTVTVDSAGHAVYHLLAGSDPNKDQSYFLCQLSQEQLRYAMFPVGDLLKPEVRRIAEGQGLATAKRKDSQGICFVGKVDLPVFLQQKLASKRGNVHEILPSWPKYAQREVCDSFVGRIGVGDSVADGSDMATLGSPTDAADRLVPTDEQLAAWAAPWRYTVRDGKKIGEHTGAHFYTIGYCMGRSWWHQGIMSEALGAVIEFLFQRVGVERIVARHDVNNPHSGGVMRKCGMNFEGIREKAHRNNQGVIDTAQYFIERGDR